MLPRTPLRGPPSCVWGECQKTLKVTDQPSCAHTGAAAPGPGCPSPGDPPNQVFLVILLVPTIIVTCGSESQEQVFRVLQSVLAVEKEQTCKPQRSLLWRFSNPNTVRTGPGSRGRGGCWAGGRKRCGSRLRDAASVLPPSRSCPRCSWRGSNAEQPMRWQRTSRVLPPWSSWTSLRV